MKYRVSLLPDRNRKRIIGKKKAEKAKSVALVILLVLLANVLILTLCFTFSQAQKAEIDALNNEYIEKASSLQKYRDINTNLQNKISLIKSIQVKEPSLYNFVAALANIEHPGITINTIDCADWKSARTCTISGTAQARSAFNEYLKALQAEKKLFKSVNCTSYTVTIVEGQSTAEFTISVNCDGGSSVNTTAQSTESTTASE